MRSPTTYSGCRGTQRGQSVRLAHRRLHLVRDPLDQQTVLRDRERMRAPCLAVPARDAGKPVAMSSISISSGEGSSRSRRRPDSMRCQARGAAGQGIFHGRLRFLCVLDGRQCRSFDPGSTCLDKVRAQESPVTFSSNREDIMSRHVILCPVFGGDEDMAALRLAVMAAGVIDGHVRALFVRPSVSARSPIWARD